MSEGKKEIDESFDQVIELETLYYVVASNIKNSTLFWNLSRIRASVYANSLVLRSKLNDESFDWLFKTATENMPEAGLGDLLAIIGT